MLPAIAETGLGTVFAKAEEIFKAFFLLKRWEDLTPSSLIFVTSHNKMSISLNYISDFLLTQGVPC